MRLIQWTTAAAIAAVSTATIAIDYPPSRRVDHVDIYHGVEVADPYRWLEDNDSDATRHWVKAQNALTREVIDAMPSREHINAHLTKLWRYERSTVPVRAGGRHLYESNDGTQNHSILYVQDLLEDPPRVLIDPNSMSADGSVALTQWTPSPDGRWLAYATATAGSDWNRVRIRDIGSGADRGEVLERIKFSTLAWTHDNAGFFYSRYPEPETTDDGVFDSLADQRLYYHRIGTPQSQDTLIAEAPEHPNWGFLSNVTDDGRYHVVSIWRGSANVNQLWVQDLGDPASPRLNAPFRRLVDDFNASYQLVGNRGPELFLLTDRDAPKRRLIKVDLRRPAAEHWATVIPESADVLKHVEQAGGQLVAVYMHDAAETIERFTLAGRRLAPIELPGLGRLGVYGSTTAANISGRADSPDLFYAYSSFAQPLTIYQANLESGQSQTFRAPDLKFDPSEYVTRQVFFTSRDGTRVPMFISHRKGLSFDGTTPTLLHAYGGFDLAMTPWYSVPYFTWMDMGGVFAVANIRGGGEYGSAWHKAGTVHNKQNVFDDFIAAAGYLINNDYTAPEHLAITGRSNGGLLMGAVTNQMPWLFGAVVADVGVMDMLRFHKFTIGWAWTGDYGSSDDPEQFRTLMSYSPYHNIRPGTDYPAVLVTTGDHDDRVVPGHSYKYTARLQAAQGGDDPVLIRVDTAAGHRSGKPLDKQIDEHSDRLTFMWHHTR